MTEAGLVALAEAYFAALDARDPEDLAATLAEEAVLSIETHGIAHTGRDAIVRLFAARWEGPLRARHHDFTHSPAAAHGRITSQFTVTYTGPEAPDPKSNANVLTVAGDRIARVQVYMAGDNTIRT
ncbi:MAG: nuclear transport factor 2 family protein [Pseudomonadota bacterium]